MKISTLFYSIGQGIKNLYRNKLFSLASIGTIMASMLVFGILFFVTSNISYIIDNFESSTVSVSVFFDEGISDGVKEQIKNNIEQRGEVSEVVYTSAKEAWEKYKEENYKGDESLSESFGDVNPLANSDNYTVYLNDVTMQDSLVSFIEGLDGVRQVNCDKKIAQGLTTINNIVSIASSILIIILIGVSIFLISTMVSIGVSVRSEEIKIMKLIGAKDSFVRAPFIVEGLIVGLIGSLLPIGILVVVYRKIISYIYGNYANVLGGKFDFLSVGHVFSRLIPIILAMGIIIGLIGTMTTLRKKLKV